LPQSVDIVGTYLVEELTDERLKVRTLDERATSLVELYRSRGYRLSDI